MRGVLVLTAGAEGEVIELSPPLVIEEAELERGDHRARGGAGRGSAAMSARVGSAPAPRGAAPAERREAEALAARIHDFIARTATAWSADPAELDALLLAGFAHQVRWNAAYARYAAARGATPESTGRALDIPPIPARAFGLARLATFPPELTRRRFRSSGTTGGARAVLELDALALAIYDAALRPAFRRSLLPDAGEPALDRAPPRPGARARILARLHGGLGGARARRHPRLLRAPGR